MTLQQMIDAQEELSHQKKVALARILIQGRRIQTVRRIRKMVFDIPLTLWPTCNLYSRFQWVGDHWDYACGQDYPTEISQVVDDFLRR